MGEKYVVSASKIRISGFFFGFSVMGVGVFSWGYEERERDACMGVVAWLGKYACMGDTWVLALALGGESERGREGGIGCRGFVGREFFLLCMYWKEVVVVCSVDVRLVRAMYYCGNKKKRKEIKLGLVILVYYSNSDYSYLTSPKRPTLRFSALWCFAP